MDDTFLVSTDWLADHLGDPDVRVLDVSGFHVEPGVNGAYDDYLAEHIPGAVWFDVCSSHGVLSDPDAELWWTWPAIERIEAAMSSAGVGDDTTVVITARTYDRPLGLGTMWCTRAWWTLHHSGVRCAILEGGLERWRREGRSVESGPVEVPAADFHVEDRRAEAIAHRDDVERALADGASCVIDALPTESYTGQRSNYARPGHIAGAGSLPYGTFIAEPTAAFIPLDEATEAFRTAGVFDVERAVLY